jgi:DinB superfamily
MTGNDLAKMFEFSYMAMHRNLDGLGHQESLVVPQPCGGNCLNWVFGHAIAARNMVLMLAGGGPAMTGEKLAIYQRGSSPSDPSEYLDLATLRGFFDDSQRQLIPALVAISDETLEEPVPETYRRPPLTGSIGDALIRLHYHEGYHNGQIGLLRRIAGKEGVIK